MDEAKAVKEAERLTRIANAGRPPGTIRAAVAEAIRRTRTAFALATPPVGVVALNAFVLKPSGRLIRAGEVMRLPREVARVLAEAGLVMRVDYIEPEDDLIVVFGAGEAPRFLGLAPGP